MCEPTTLIAASIAMSALSTGASFYGQSQSAKAQEKIQARQVQQNRDATLAAYRNNVRDANTKFLREEEETGRRLRENNIRALQATSSARVSAGEAGIAGNTAESLFGDFDRIKSINNSILKNNLDHNTTQLGFTQNSLKDQAHNRILQVQPGVIERPSAAVSLLSFGSQAAGSFANFKLAQKAASRK